MINIRKFFRAGLIGKNLRNSFTEKFWRLRPKSAGLHFQKYKKNFPLRKYEKFFHSGFFRKNFGVEARKWRVPFPEI